MSDTPITGHIEDYLADYMTGELSPDTHDQIERHLGACDQCQSALAESIRIRLLLAALAEDGTEIASVTTRVRCALTAEKNERGHDFASVQRMSDRTRYSALDRYAQVPVGPPHFSRRRSRSPLWIGLVAVFLLTILSALIFSHFGAQPGRITGIATQTRSLTPGPYDTPSPLPTAVLPPGWQTIAPGKRFTGNAGEVGLVASVAKPGRIAGCALPANALQPDIPIFMLSDDGGTIWQTHAIPGIGAMQTCYLIADTKRMDTFVISGQSYLFVTEDAGKTWRVLPRAPTIGPGIPTLVDGHLIGLWNYKFGEMTLDGTWRPLDTAFHFMTGPGVINIRSVAVDPHNPAHIYVALPTSDADPKFGLLLYSTSNSGASWQMLKEWPGDFKAFSLWVASDGVVYYNKVYPDDVGGNPLYWSLDGGVTWRYVPAPENGGLGSVALSPQGRFLDIYQDIRVFDSKTGLFRSLAIQGPKISYSALGLYAFVFVDAPSPVLIGLSQIGTYAVPLKSLI